MANPAMRPSQDGIIQCNCRGATSKIEEIKTKLQYNKLHTVTQPGTFYLMFRSFSSDPALGNTAKCVSKRPIKVMESRVKYLKPSDKSFYQGLQRLPSLIYVYYVCSMAGTTTYRLVYSDYGICDVFVVSDTNEKKCELWVKEGYQQYADDIANAVASRDQSIVDVNITKCKQEYLNRCKEQYQIYDKDMCSGHEK
ncbi:uncharacterized protein LOC121835742 [Ixodes scapularis]|uniref:uncharacterized protein LOC121835742 n=1 Tax=Ixodes scapularis TaxID=6945 RepID=UPI001C392A23|nr:uncharacterized protein LOC121835742 [Ixodes scapularis]